MKLYNTLKKQKVQLTPLIKDQVTIYSCGPTVYNFAHIGNLRAFLFMDTLRRVVEFNDYNANLVMNITDVGHLTDDADEGEDKMEKGAKREGKTVWQIAEFYTNAFLKDIKKLNIKTPTTICKATDHIKEQIDMIKKIVQNGFTYITSDGVYFDTSKLSDYGKLIPNFNPENLEAGKRVSMGEKKNLTDFALWKFSFPNEKRQMKWESPWGTGFPGWHIECTAMGCKYLGNKIDIHTGGIEHIPIHHTNEIAQAQAANGEEHVNIWLHNEHLLVNSNKMSKSLGNVYTLSDLEEKEYSPLDFRLLCFSTHYRKNLNFTFEALNGAKNARKKIISKLKNINTENSEGQINQSLHQEFKEALNDDLNTPVALSILHKTLDADIPNQDKVATIEKFEEVLALNLFEKETYPTQVLNLVEERELARQQKNFELSDHLRDKIQALGYEVKDTKTGQILSKK